ncbi:hypothetical protein GOP47_0008089 [Adiantum capillus-veneris]|uniref:ADP-ribosyl cyclase/cyclic ADP-ribose hydrolase n=1 Tax=Adiantum capillus-veneris TaxID=13818 RepID=A0A9D4UXV9_ADICA|nr:hypothetical protein GOP47_0008089 [Adiantum capillus-veneris]
MVETGNLLCNGNGGEEGIEDIDAKSAISMVVAIDLISRPTDAPMGNYDIFLNHRGPNMNKSYVDHLFASFEAVRILHCFVDYKSIHAKEQNWGAIEHTIHHSKVHIVIFSPGYAAYSWCLRELVNILECRSSGWSQLFLLIFFKVFPDDLHHINSASTKSCYSLAFHKLAEWNDSQAKHRYSEVPRAGLDTHQP